MSSKDTSHDEIVESLRTMDIDEDLAWVLDSLIGFLKSPIWTTSLNNFVDQHSVVFEPDEIENVDGKIRVIPEYETIFDEYRGLVDRLITTHMTELGINEKAFAMACEMADGILAGRLKAVLFEELWAAENYEVFTRWMAKRNVELQLEALNTLAARHGMIYDVFVPFGSDGPDFIAGKNLQKNDISRETKNYSSNSTGSGTKKVEQEEVVPPASNRKLSQQIEVEAEVVGPGDDILPIEAEEEILKIDKDRLEEVRSRVDSRIQESLLTILQSSPEPENEGSPSHVESKTTKPVNVQPTENSPKEQQENVITADTERKQQAGLKHLLSDQTTDSLTQRTKSAEIEKRAEYLRAQRDRIIALRAKERTEHIAKYIKGKGKQDQDGKKDDPSTSSSAKDNTSPVFDNQESQNPELAYRKSLAARLKAEIGGFSANK